MSGYLAERYAVSLGYFGRPVRLHNSESWVLEREIKDSSCLDIAGCYPLMACKNWLGVEADIANLDDQYASFTMVADPLGSYSPDLLQSAFPDLCTVFKYHYIIDLQSDYTRTYSSTHKRNAKKARKSLSICREDTPVDVLDPWIEMYQNLVQRHQITGVSAFSSHAFFEQLQTSGIIVYTARMGAKLVGMILFYEMAGHVYYHLGAYLQEGYDNKASFGIFDEAIHDFSQAGYGFLNMGGGAGAEENAEDGLSRFKRGWASHSRPAYLCGKILNRSVYNTLVQKRGGVHSGFFPAYRYAM